jgi:hypothetical protein
MAVFPRAASAPAGRVWLHILPRRRPQRHHASTQPCPVPCQRPTPSIPINPFLISVRPVRLNGTVYCHKRPCEGPFDNVASLVGVLVERMEPFSRWILLDDRRGSARRQGLAEGVAVIGAEGPSVRKRTVASCTRCSVRDPQLLETELATLAKSHSTPALIFWRAVDWLVSRRIEIPTSSV